MTRELPYSADDTHIQVVRTPLIRLLGVDFSVRHKVARSHVPIHPFLFNINTHLRRTVGARYVHVRHLEFRTCTPSRISIRTRLRLEHFDPSPRFLRVGIYRVHCRKELLRRCPYLRAVHGVQG
jgi:hypothetical protein